MNVRRSLRQRVRAAAGTVSGSMARDRRCRRTGPSLSPAGRPGARVLPLCRRGKSEGAEAETHGAKCLTCRTTFATPNREHCYLHKYLLEKLVGIMTSRVALAGARQDKVSDLAQVV